MCVDIMDAECLPENWHTLWSVSSTVVAYITESLLYISYPNHTLHHITPVELLQVDNLFLYNIIISSFSTFNIGAVCGRRKCNILMKILSKNNCSISNFHYLKYVYTQIMEKYFIIR